MFLLKKRVFMPLALVAVLLAGFVFLKQSHLLPSLDPQTEALKKQVEAFLANRPAERIYLQTDKTFYKPTETIWFQVFLREEQTLKVAATSDILYVELLNPKGSVEQTKNLILQHGTAAGDFEIAEGMMGGLYKIRAYTNVTKNNAKNLNNPEDFGAGAFEKEITVQQVVLPRLQMVLDFEKEGYGATDEVQATLQLKNLENQPLAQQTFRFKAALAGNEIENGTGKTNVEGKTTIKFRLPNKLTSADGLLNILIDYQGQTESISRSIPITFDNIKVVFFPEGGDMIMNLNNRIALKATNEFGKGTDIEGFVESDKGKKMTEVATIHKGMGSFYFVPEIDTKYFLKITKPKGIAKKYELPELLPVGYILAVKNVEKEAINVEIQSNVTPLNDSEKLRVVTQIRGEIYQGQELKATKGTTNLKISTENMPMGVAQITLFDSKNIARAERLVFVNEHRQLKIEVKTDKSSYQPREKVKMTISAKDERGLPTPAQLALAVTDEKILTFADDKQSNILTALLLEADIDTKIEEPNFYLNPSPPTPKGGESPNPAPKGEGVKTPPLGAGGLLDHVLLTSGWRRFTWKEVASNQPFQPRLAAEKAVIGGVVYQNGKPIEKAQILYGKLQYVHTDSKGRFAIHNYALYEPLVLEVTLPDKSFFQYTITEYGENYELQHSNLNLLRRNEVWRGADDDMEPAKVEDLNLNDKVRNPRQELKELPKKPKVLNVAPQPAPDVKKPVDVVVANKNEKAKQQNKEQKPAAEKVAATNQPAMPAGSQVADARLRKEAKKDVAAGKRRQEIIRNDDFRRGVAEDELAGEVVEQAPASVRYVRAREFAAVDYAQDQNPALRTDFRSTIFWKGNLQLDRKGKAEVEFYNSDEITTFRATVEGVGDEGSVGRAEYSYFTQKPFSLDLKLPIALSMGDEVFVPVTLANNTDQMLKGNLQLKLPKAFQLSAKQPKGETENFSNRTGDLAVALPAKTTKTLLFACQVLNKVGKDTFAVAFSAGEAKDALEKEIEITAKGFPSAVSFAGQEMEKTFAVTINEPIEGTVSAVFEAYPSTLSDLMSGLEGMLREPYGCFEQTSSTTYPNILVLNYLKETDYKDAAVVARAEKLIKTGYQKLTAYETKEKGYEWFGGTPAHEALTAYGLMEFKDMQQVAQNQVDNAMVSRTTDWLLSRRDGKGGFLRSPQALDQFGRADQDVTNAYIIYALAEAGVKDIDREIEQAFDRAKQQEDAYQLALVANALLLQKDSKRAATALEKLLPLQKANGAWVGKKTSITSSYGQAFEIETTSLTLLALLKSKTLQGFENLARLNTAAAIDKAARFLIGSRQYGSFGNTQSTILALKALIAHTKYSKQTAENGLIEIYVDNKKVATQNYLAGRKESIKLENWQQSLTKGTHEIKVKYVGCKNPLPYSVGIQWHTNLPVSQNDCKVSLQTDLASKKTKVGETIRLTTTLQNKTAEGQPMTVAIVGIPAGLGLQAWQLKELQEKKVIDFYETTGNNVVFYYRQLLPNEKKTIHLDLKAEIAGEYEAAASAAFLYYTNELKTWVKPERVRVE